MKVDILGTDYDFKITTDKEDTVLCDKDGYCDPYAKIIAVEDDYNDKAQDCTKNMDAFKRKVKRHEIIHAYLYESGLKHYAEDETIVDWIAWQLPRIVGSCKIVDALGGDTD